MGRPSAIPERLHEAVRERAADGASTRGISSWLLDEHNVEASYSAVARLLREFRAERAEAITDQVQEVLVKSATSDLTRLDSLLERMESDETSAREALGRTVASGDEDSGTDQERGLSPGEEASMRRVLVANQQAQRQVLETKLKLTGAGEPKPEQPEELGAGVLERMLRLAGGEHAGATSTEPGPGDGSGEAGEADGGD